jgi:hypothetical protein
MTFLTATLHPAVSMLALFQGTQLNLFERFLTQSLSGIDSTSITSGMQNVAYVVLLVGFLWQVYQSALHGGDVRGLGTNLIKYVATALVIMNYSSVFSTLNQGFVNAGNWIGNASGAGNLFDNWKNDIQTQFNQDANQQLWSLISGGIAGLIDGLLIIVAYILYPVVIAIFGFFYIFYGSILYIFGPIVIALLPLNAANRIAKAYIENVFIWNAWPILYGGFGALLSAVQMGQVGQMLSQGSFLGGLGNLEGSFLIGLASIIYSLAIAIIPFIAKRIVSGDVGSTATAMMGAAATALTAGVAAVEGVAAGAAAAGTTGSAGTGGTIPVSSSTGSASFGTSAIGNQPAAAQRTSAAPGGQSTNGSPDSSSTGGASNIGSAPGSGSRTFSQVGTESSSTSTGQASSPLGEAHAEQIRDALRSISGPGGATASSTTTPGAGASAVDANSKGSKVTGGRQSSGSRLSPGSSAALGRRHGIASWGAYHAARLATQGLVAGGRTMANAGGAVVEALQDPTGTAGRLASAAGRTAGSLTNAIETTSRVAQSVAQKVSHPTDAVRGGVDAASSAVSDVLDRAASTAKGSVDAAKAGFISSYERTRRENQRES